MGNRHEFTFSKDDKQFTVVLKIFYVTNYQEMEIKTTMKASE